jgi:hypothetical protein
MYVSNACLGFVQAAVLEGNDASDSDDEYDDDDDPLGGMDSAEFYAMMMAMMEMRGTITGRKCSKSACYFGWLGFGGFGGRRGFQPRGSGRGGSHCESVPALTPRLAE